MKEDEEMFALPIVKAEMMKMDTDRELMRYFQEINEKLNDLNNRVDYIWNIVKKVPAKVPEKPAAKPAQRYKVKDRG